MSGFFQGGLLRPVDGIRRYRAGNVAALYAMTVIPEVAEGAGGRILGFAGKILILDPLYDPAKGVNGGPHLRGFAVKAEGWIVAVISGVVEAELADLLPRPLLHKVGVDLHLPPVTGDFALSGRGFGVGPLVGLEVHDFHRISGATDPIPVLLLQPRVTQNLLQSLLLQRFIEKDLLPLLQIEIVPKQTFRCPIPDKFRHKRFLYKGLIGCITEAEKARNKRNTLRTRSCFDPHGIPERYLDPCFFNIA